jgi:hypothetical protein
VAVDEVGNLLTSTNPTGGVGSWQSIRLPQVSRRTNGFRGVSCPTASFCVANSAGRFATSTNPAGGAGAWNVHPDPGSSFFGLITCASASLCIATNGPNELLVSVNPMAPTPSWSSLSLATGSASIVGLSCASASFCAAVDETGQVFTSTNPTGGVSAWPVTNLTGHPALLEPALGLLDDLQIAYIQAEPNERRLLNQAFFERIELVDEKVVGFRFADPFGLLLGQPPVNEDGGDDWMGRWRIVEPPTTGSNPGWWARSGSCQSKNHRPHF